MTATTCRIAPRGAVRWRDHVMGQRGFLFSLVSPLTASGSEQRRPCSQRWRSHDVWWATPPNAAGFELICRDKRIDYFDWLVWNVAFSRGRGGAPSTWFIDKSERPLRSFLFKSSIFPDWRFFSDWFYTTICCSYELKWKVSLLGKKWGDLTSYQLVLQKHESRTNHIFRTWSKRSKRRSKSWISLIFVVTG